MIFSSLIGYPSEGSTDLGTPFIRSFLLALYYSTDTDDLIRILLYHKMLLELMESGNERHNFNYKNDGFKEYFFLPNQADTS